VEQVTWEDATNYCAALTLQDLAAGRIPTNCSYRLPTEAEYEYAYRAGTTTRFPYGNDPGYTSLTNYEWFGNIASNMTHPVGQKQPNPWGLYDMAGNVGAWCHDWHAPLPGGSVLDPQGPPDGVPDQSGPGSPPFHVVRVSAWNGGDLSCRCAFRSFFDDGSGDSSLGIRVVLGLSR
jgi:formylglycine-generating enzyme required for sulfatase activity